MKRRYKVATAICLLAVAGGAVIFLRPSGEPDILAKAQTLRQGMNEKEVLAVLEMNEAGSVGTIGSLSQVRERTTYRYGCGDRCWRALWSSKFPFIHPQRHWDSRAGTLDVIFVRTIDDAEAKLVEIRFNLQSDAPFTKIQLLPPTANGPGP